MEENKDDYDDLSDIDDADEGPEDEYDEYDELSDTDDGSLSDTNEANKKKFKKEKKRQAAFEYCHILADFIADIGIKVVVFDLDRTACKMHSGGVISISLSAEYIISASVDFTTIVPMLIANGIIVCIGTFTDRGYYNLKRFPRHSYIAGEDLVERFLSANLAKNIKKQIFVCCFNSSVRIANGENILPGKNYHIAELKEQINAAGIIVNDNDFLLFDDSGSNIDTAIGFWAILVDPNYGFRTEQAYNYLRKLNDSSHCRLKDKFEFILIGVKPIE